MALAAIDIGGVEQGDAGVDRLVHHPARGVEIDAAAEIVAAEADLGDTQPGAAEVADLHGRFSCLRVGASQSGRGPSGTMPFGLIAGWLW